MSAAHWTALRTDAGAPIFLAICGAAAWLIYWLVLRSVFWCYDRLHLRGVVRQSLGAEAERLFPDGDCDPEAPCSLWDFRGDRPVEVICRNHLPSGRHHPPTSLYVGAEPPVVADLQLWEQEMQG